MSNHQRTLALSIFVAFFALLVQPSASSAQEAEQKPGTRSVKVAIIDLEEIALKSVAVQDIRRQVEAYAAEFRKVFQAEEEALRNAQEALAKQRAILAQDAFADESKKFQARVVDSQRKMQSKRDALAQVQGEAMLKVLKARDEAIKAVVTERSIALVLRAEATIVNIPQMDITEDVLTQLNENLTAVAVTSPDKVAVGGGKK